MEFFDGGSYSCSIEASACAARVCAMATVRSTSITRAFLDILEWVGLFYLLLGRPLLTVGLCCLQ